MDPISIITTALIAGAAAGGKDAASTAVRDAYSVVRDRIHRVAANRESIAVIDANEKAGGNEIAKIEGLVVHNNLAADDEVLEAAKQLLSCLAVNDLKVAADRIDLSHAQGVQVGDQNTQNNTFGSTQ